MSGTDYTTTPNLGLYKPIANRAIGQWGDFLNSNADTLDATMAHLSGGPFLPLAGGTITGPVNFFNDPALGIGAQFIFNRSWVWGGLTTDSVNKPVRITNTITGAFSDPATSLNPATPMVIINNLGAVNNNGTPVGYNSGFRDFQGLEIDAICYPGTLVGIVNPLTALAGQTRTAGSGKQQTTWLPSTAYGVGDHVINLNFYNALYRCEAHTGPSAATGTGPTGYGPNLITDGGVTWSYQGPGVPPYWAPFTSYPTKGAMITNPNNGGLYRVEVPGVSGALPGPIRVRQPRVDVLVASTANIPVLSGLLTIDGIALPEAARVLVKDQIAQATNGIYLAHAGAWLRDADSDTWDELIASYTTVDSGNINVGRGFLCTVPHGGTLGTDPITWVAAPLPNSNAIPDGSVVWSNPGSGLGAYAMCGIRTGATALYNVGGKSMDETVGMHWGAIIGSTGGVNATFWNARTCLEIDDAWSGSVRRSTALVVTRTGNQAAHQDVGIIVSAQVAANQAYKNALLFNNCMDSFQGYGIAFENQGGGGVQHMAGGIDMRMVVPDGTAGPFGGGFVLRGVNGMYDGAGAWQMRFGSIVPTASGLTVDVTNAELQTVAIVPGQGGKYWQVGAAWKGSDGSYGLALTVDTANNNAMLTAGVIIPSQVPATALPTSITLSGYGPNNPGTTQFGHDPVPGIVGPTGAALYPQSATATPTYAVPVTPTLNFGTGVAKAINIGNTGSATNFAGTVTLPASIALPGGPYLPTAGGIVAGPLTVTGQSQLNFASAQSVLIQGNTGLPVGGVSSGLALIGADGINPGIRSYSFQSANPFTEFGSYGARGTLAVPTAVASGDVLARFSGRGYNGTAYSNSAFVQVTAAENFGATNTGTAVELWGIPVGTTTPLRWVYISNGDVSVGINTDWGYRLDVNSAVASSRFNVTNSATPTGVIISGLQPSVAVPPMLPNTQLMLSGAPAAANIRQAFMAGNNSVGLLSFAKNAGLISGPFAATPAQSIGSIEALGYDTAWTTTPNANIVMASPAVWSATSHPAYITFGTTAINSVTLAEVMRVSPNGNLLVGTTTDPTGAGAVVCAQFVNGNAGPSWTSGSAVPAATQPKGSLYTRTGGAVGSTLYVSQGAGTWNAVAGV